MTPPHTATGLAMVPAPTLQEDDMPNTNGPASQEAAQWLRRARWAEMRRALVAKHHRQNDDARLILARRAAVAELARRSGHGVTR